MKKLISVIFALALVVSCFAGCGTSPAATPASSGAPSGSAPASAPAAPASPEKVNLNVFLSYQQFADQFDAYFAQFKGKMQAEKNVEVSINLETPGSDQYQSILQTRLASGDGPDVYALHAKADLPTYVLAGYTLDLSDQPFVGKLYEGAKTAVAVDGKVYAVPLESVSWGYLYNKDIFSEVGITPVNTLDEMKSNIEKLKNAGYTPFQLAFSDAWVPQLMTALTLGDVVAGKIPDWLDRMYKDEGSYSEVAEIFDVIDLIIENGTPRAMETNAQQGAADFADGKAAMFIQGTWSAESILTVNPDFNLGVAPLPINNDPGCTRIDLSTSTCVVVNPESTQKETALDLVNYLLDDNDSSGLFQELKFNPLATVHDYPQFPWVEEATKNYVEKGRTFKDLKIPNSVTDEQGKLLQSYYTKQVTKEQIMDQLDAAFKAANKAAAEAAK